MTHTQEQILIAPVKLLSILNYKICLVTDAKVTWFLKVVWQKNDNTAYANADAVALTNNGIMYLFSSISYRLSSQEIESVHNPGEATTMLGLRKYPDDF